MSSWISGFADGFLAYVAIIVAIITAFDWLVGEDGRRRLKEYVGDFWTTLQYHSFEELYAGALQHAKTKIANLYGEKVLSSRFLVTAFAINFLWVSVSVVAMLFWTPFGKELIALLPPLTAGTYVGLAITMVVFVFAIGWYPMASFFWLARRLASGTSLRRVFYAPIFVLWNALIFVVLAAIIIFVAWMVFVFGAYGGENFDQLMQQMIREKEMGADPAKNEAWEHFANNYLLPFMAFTFLILLPISLLPFLALLLIVLVLVCLKILRPLLQPLVSRLLERLYESEQGVLTQVTVIFGVVAKFVQEVGKLAV
jgi:hypothetical protein